MARKWPVTLGLLHRPLHAHAWKLAQPGGNRNRNLRAAVFGQPENPRPQDAPTGSACLESADESRSRQDQLEVRSKSRSPQVRLQKEILHAVKDLGVVDALDVLGNGNEEGACWMYYRVLNCGLKCAASSGSDSRMDVMRHAVSGGGKVYVKSGNPLTYEKWVAGYKAGRTFVTNGPMLFLEVDGK